MSSVYNLVLGVSKDMSRMGEDVELQVKGKERKYIMEMAWNWESSPGFKFYHLLLWKTLKTNFVNPATLINTRANTHSSIFAFFFNVTNEGFCLFKVYLFLEGGEGRKKERERNINQLPLGTPPTEDLAHNPGMCPDWESNQRSFDSQAGTQSTEPHQPGLLLFLRVIDVTFCSVIQQALTEYLL